MVGEVENYRDNSADDLTGYNHDARQLPSDSSR
jgi:hypothetical protein